MAGALNKVLQKAKEGLSRVGASVTTVDNKANPASAYSIAKRKMDDFVSRDKFKSHGKLVPFRNDEQKARYKGAAIPAKRRAVQSAMPNTVQMGKALAKKKLK